MVKIFSKFLIFLIIGQICSFSILSTVGFTIPYTIDNAIVRFKGDTEMELHGVLELNSYGMYEMQIKHGLLFKTGKENLISQNGNVFEFETGMFFEGPYVNFLEKDE